jgi:colanic acid biosynthesis glycosyl transferase WcaI
MPKNKTITVITGNYFPEDTAIGLYTRQFSILLKENGYQVKVITGFPNYPQWKIYDKYIDLPSYLTETIDGIEIIRYKQYVPEKVNLKGRIIMMVDLFYGTFSNMKKVKNTDLVICIVPFTISIFPALILSKLRKAKLWVHIQDFEFDLALDTGVINNNTFFLKIFKLVISTFERKMLNSALVVSSISLSM